MQQSNASGFNINNFGGASEFKNVVQNLVSLINTGDLVEVIDVATSGLAPVGFVSVKPLTLRTDADNNNIEQSIIHGVPYFRLQGGTNAIICDPQVGDIGWCGFCSRDISLVKRIRAMAATNVYRVSDISDAVFFGGWSNKTPTQYIMFNENGLNIKTTGNVNINGLTITADGTLITKDGDVVDKHNHGGVQSGSSNTLPLGG
jgi:hypothetical protein